MEENTPNSEQSTSQSQQPQASDQTLICKSCGAVNPSSAFFCLNCGKAIQVKPLSTSILAQIGIYLLSFLLPPLGLWPGIKYLKGKNQKEQVIGIAAIILTVVSIIITIWSFMILMNNVQSILNSSSGL